MGQVFSCCFRFADIEYEDDPRPKYQYVWNGQTWFLYDTFLVGFASLHSKSPKHHRRVHFSDSESPPASHHRATPVRRETLSAIPRHGQPAESPTRDARQDSIMEAPGTPYLQPPTVPQTAPPQNLPSQPPHPIPTVAQTGQQVFGNYPPGFQPSLVPHDPQAPYPHGFPTFPAIAGQHPIAPPPGFVPGLVPGFVPPQPPPQEHRGPTGVGVNFQPQVPDTNMGPQMHLYTPRYDGLPPGAVWGHHGFHQAAAQSYPQHLPQAYPQAQAQQYHPYQLYAQMHQGNPVGDPRMHWNQVLPQQPVFQGPDPVAQQTGGAAIPLQHLPEAPIAIAPMTAPLVPTLVQYPPGLQPFMQPQVVHGTAIPVPNPAGGQPVYGQVPPQAITGNAPPMGAAPVPNVHFEAAMGVGLTGSQVAMRIDQWAYNTNIDEPQDFKPADDNALREYRVREADGSWSVKNRMTIDDLGDCRWYIDNHGIFYAVRSGL
ncbi:hypothetical protein B0T26DRAFT_674479 [Lasiosphaeria miniovina]|uniref:Uncharacterized protein n=1 Tax=Lasiosphaeria miniovina TaxID=1954250 RepID=A0AA40DZZ7_9PEZI|nr:uncharacterized protein B0T26DRAFT_674479 [Lasiosphaeria miniovina]KAK0722824.1 hypothetical protein B0T26DRAFT_674479 [Lasiosphaeria miniovina]